MSGLESVIKEARDAPYKKPITAVVYGISPICNYRKADGEERQMVTLGLADKHAAVKGILYDISKLSQIREGSTYFILNSITKKEPTPSVVITKMTKICKTGSIADSVPEDLRQRASAFAHPPTAEIKTIAQAQASPSKVLSTVQGQVIVVEMPRSVQVSGNPTPIKDVVIKDGSGKCKLTLWRDLAEAEVTTGSWIKATNIQTKTYNSDTYFSSTSRTAIMTIDSPKQWLDTEVIAYGFIDADMIEITVNEGDLYPSYCMKVETLAAYMDCSTSELDGVLEKKLPFNCKIAVQNEQIEEILRSP